MKYSIILFIALFTAFSTFGILTGDAGAYAQNKSTHSSHVIAKVPGLTLEQYNKIATHYMKNSDIEIAYYCLESGVLAMHYNHSGLTNADVQSRIKSQLQKLIKSPNIRILDVDTRNEDKNSRC